jgi:hypothetical protein
VDLPVWMVHDLSSSHRGDAAYVNGRMCAAIAMTYKTCIVLRLYQFIPEAAQPDLALARR